MRHLKTVVRSRVVPIVTIAALLCSMVLPTSALAYFNFGTVTVAPGSSYLTVNAGATASTNVSVSPASHAQTQGCGMAGCPQVCEGDGAMSAGYHCFDANGQCTCSGKNYTTYYPQTTAYSSNSGVASAYMSGNTLVVTGKAAGTATITIQSSLRQWSTGSATVTVKVNAPAGGNNGGSNSGASSSSDNNGGGASSSNNGQGQTGSTGSSAKATAAGIPEAADVTSSTDDSLNEQTLETEGGTVVLVENNSYLNTAEELKKIAGKQAQLIIWAGASSDQPDYSWTFWGEDIDPDSENLDFDPTVTISDTGTGSVANIMKQAKDGRVFELACKGDLPAKGTLTIKAGEKFPDDTKLKLFRFGDGKDEVFSSAQDDEMTVSSGYVSFQTEKGGTFAASTDDLAQYKVAEQNTPGAAKKQKEANDKAAQSKEDGTPVLIAVAVVVIAAAAALVAVLAIRRKRAQDAVADRVAEAATTAGGAPADETADVEKQEDEAKAEDDEE